MNTFADWLAASAGMREAMERLQAQFRLSEQEMREATQALAPAFMLGLKRLYANQAAFADMATRFANLPLNSKPAGSAAMQGLFGGAGLADAIARQASMASGIAPDTLLRMMPSLSAMTMDAFLNAANATPGRHALPSDTAGVWMAEFMRRSANAVEAFNRPSEDAKPAHNPADAMARFFTDSMRNMTWPFAMGTGPEPEAKPARRARKPEAAPDEKPEPPRSPVEAVFEMMDAGRTMQTNYWREMMVLFDRHKTGGEDKAE